MDEWRILVRLPARVRDFSSLQIVKTGFEAQPLLSSVYLDEGGGVDTGRNVRMTTFPKEFNISILYSGLFVEFDFGP